MTHNEELYRIPLPALGGASLSEFNHHLAGVAVLLIGMSAMLMRARPRQFGFLGYVWPASLLLLGFYLIVYSDPPYWPSGHASLSETLANAQSRQHKVYAILVVVIGAIELGRTSRLLRRDLWKYAFPMLGLGGALYLVVHEHGGGHGEHGDHMAHAAVLYQHITYIVLGVGIAASRILYDVRVLGGRWGPYIWPFFTILLGLALLFYWE